MKSKHTSDISYKKRQKITHDIYFYVQMLTVRILNLRAIQERNVCFLGNFENKSNK